MKRILKKILPLFILQFIRSLINGNYSYFFWLFPIRGNKIVICNFYGLGFGDNSKYIVNELINRNMDCDIVWLLRKDTDSKELPNNIRYCKYGSLRALYELSTARIWIDNSRKRYYPPKRKGQYYIQTWHGGLALKKVEKDVENKLDNSYVFYAKKDSKMADLFISNSRFCTDMYRTAFWYNGNILESGSPRCDILLRDNSNLDKKVKKYFDIDTNTKILIYAPTFRANESIEEYKIDFDRLINELEDKFGFEWNILIRLHPNIANKQNFIGYTSKIKNATDYADMYELLSVSDILITDYSCTMFEFSFTKRPVFLYASDIEAYSDDRNFYFDVRSLPYTLAENNAQLFDIIKQFDLDNYLEKVNSFLPQLGIMEKGTASSQVAVIISNTISKKLN